MSEVFEAIETLIESERFGAVITVLTGPEIGTKAVVDATGSLLAGSLPSTAMPGLTDDARALIAREQSRAVTYDTVEVFIEAISPPPVLVVFGAVHVAQELTRHALLLGFRVVVSDARPAFATPDRFPGATVLGGWPEDVTTDLVGDARTYVVLLSHDSRFEDPVLRWALDSPARYIGAMGSRRTHASRIERLLAAGYSDEQVARIHGPVGLDLGAERPGETAIAILAEMIQVRYGSGTGLSLHGQHGRIHRQRTDDRGDT